MNDGKNNILANEINIGKNVIISPKAEIICDIISIGDGTVIMGETRIHCKECVIGKNNFINEVWIEASLNAGNTKINIGNENLILQNTRLNCNDQLTIGNDVNIGQNVSIWTHASSMDVLNGYPFEKSPVKIGSHVWITAGTIILPGIEIGSHIIIGNSSIVNKNIPDGCFAAGSPVKIIKEAVFPKNLSTNEKIKIIEDAINDYKDTMESKGISAEIELIDDNTISITVEGEKSYFNCETREINGATNDYSEDFRDFLRYRGIKFFTDSPFRSIIPDWYRKVIKNKK